MPPPSLCCPRGGAVERGEVWAPPAPLLLGCGRLVAGRAIVSPGQDTPDCRGLESLTLHRGGCAKETPQGWWVTGKG